MEGPKTIIGFQGMYEGINIRVEFRLYLWVSLPAVQSASK